MIKLKYGCNPHQEKASLGFSDKPEPFEVLNGDMGYINALDALTAWQLVKDVKKETGLACAASFKHVNPAGVAVCLEEDKALPEFKGLSDIAIAYQKARYCDPLASYGDAVALSDAVDITMAETIYKQVSDLIIAPGFDADALDLLKKKKGGKYLLIQIDPSYEAPKSETREIFGINLSQDRDNKVVALEDIKEKLAGGISDAVLLEKVALNMCVANITLKYTLSNSIALAAQGRVIGVGAGQQSRVACVRLAADKAEKWYFANSQIAQLLQFKEGTKKFEKNNITDLIFRWDVITDEEKKYAQGFFDAPIPDEILTAKKLGYGDRADLCLCSDGFIPFRDNIDKAQATGVKYILHPGGSKNDEDMANVAKQLGLYMIATGVRTFYH